MGQPEGAFAAAQHRVLEGEARLARQAAIVEELDRDDHPEAAATARAVLATLQRSHELARQHLRMEREARGLEP